MPSPDKRQLIMQAAEKLFAARRFHEITTDDIAHVARVGKGTIYRYFRDKDDLFFQTAMSGFDELCELVGRKPDGDGGFTKELLRACRQISRFFERRRQLLRMMQGEDGLALWGRPDIRQRWRAHRGRLVGAVAAILAHGAAGGHVRKAVPPETLAHLLLGMLRTRARDMADLPERARSLETIVDVFCTGAMSPDGSARRRHELTGVET
ncbi:MAG: TetR/AcrR family transcriptional regulator [Phycisphaerae bacterium]